MVLGSRGERGTALGLALLFIAGGPLGALCRGKWPDAIMAPATSCIAFGSAKVAKRAFARREDDGDESEGSSARAVRDPKSERSNQKLCPRETSRSLRRATVLNDFAPACQRASGRAWCGLRLSLRGRMVHAGGVRRHAPCSPLRSAKFGVVVRPSVPRTDLGPHWGWGPDAGARSAVRRSRRGLVGLEAR